MWKQLMQRVRAYRPDRIEVVALVLIILNAGYWLWQEQFRLGIIVVLPFVLVFGYMAGAMLYDLWFGGRR